VTSQQEVVGSQTEVTFGSYYETKLPLGFDSSGTGSIPILALLGKLRTTHIPANDLGGVFALGIGDQHEGL
jgi:hypothetical protein